MMVYGGDRDRRLEGEKGERPGGTGIDNGKMRDRSASQNEDHIVSG
jgi:hypothetical protein